MIRPWKAARNSIDAADAGRKAAAGRKSAAGREHGAAFPQGDFIFSENLSMMDFGIRAGPREHTVDDRLLLGAQVLLDVVARQPGANVTAG